MFLVIYKKNSRNIQSNIQSNIQRNIQRNTIVSCVSCILRDFVLFFLYYENVPCILRDYIFFLYITRMSLVYYEIVYIYFYITRMSLVYYKICALNCNCQHNCTPYLNPLCLSQNTRRTCARTTYIARV